MKYDIINDIKVVSKILNLSYSEIAQELNVARSTVTRIVNGQTYPTNSFLEDFYSFAYRNKYHSIELNKLKIEYAKTLYKHLLFHGARKDIDGTIDTSHSRSDIDVGIGFYLGESYEQASSYVFASKQSSIYLFNTSKLKELKTIEFDLSLEWILMISYYRGQLSRFENSPIIQNIIKKVEQADVVIAPIADNNMYEILNRFARGDITDVQARVALSASDLGKQHVLKSKFACESVEMVGKLYMCKQEREDIETIRKDRADRVKIESQTLIESLRRQGKYVEEILK